jgi:hypothetical protein
MMELHSKYRIKILIPLILFLLACDATFTVGYPTPIIPSPAASPTATLPSLDLELVSIFYEENHENPPSSITAVIPQLEGGDDPRVQAFNEAVNLLMAGEIESFKNGLVSMSTPPLIAVSTFDSTYQVIYQGGDLWSVKFDMAIYADGAAHPGNLVKTFNYDFAHSRSISLVELFLANSQFLEVLSDYCSIELSTRDIAFNETTVGAEPTFQNYRNWNITPEGLMITFERGQVTAYAAPEQVVIVPYSVLESIVNPQGILAGFTKH